MTLSLADFGALITLFLLFIGPMLGLMQKIRKNDLHHLDAKQDEAAKAITRIEESLARIEGKIDEHVRDHATGVLH